MNEKRFMVRGIRADNEKWTEGYILRVKRDFYTEYYINGNLVVEPSVEPVAMPVICETVDEQGVEFEYAHYRCPNCLNIVHQHYRKSREPMRYKQDYCVDCGQRMSWAEIERMDGDE